MILFSHNVRGCRFVSLYNYLLRGKTVDICRGVPVLNTISSLSRFHFQHTCVCRYAGILLGITNTFATIPGMVGPVLAKELTKNVSSSLYQHTWFDSFKILRYRSHWGGTKGMEFNSELLRKVNVYNFDYPQ